MAAEEEREMSRKGKKRSIYDRREGGKRREIEEEEDRGKMGGRDEGKKQE